MTHVNLVFLNRPADGIRYAVMKKTAFGLIDIEHYFAGLGDAFLDLLDLPKGDYEIVKID